MTKLQFSHELDEATEVGTTAECAAKVIELVGTGRIIPNRRIGEASLAEELGVPRAAIRSALEHLEISGLVTRVARSGTFSREFTVTEFCDAMDVRAALEALSARLATMRITPEELESLASVAVNIDEMGQRLMSREQAVIPSLIVADLEFHMEIARISGNKRLILTLQQQHLIEYTFSLASQPEVLQYPRPDRPVPTHVELVEAMASRDSQAAGQMMRRHILRTKELRLGSFTGEID